MNTSEVMLRATLCILAAMIMTFPGADVHSAPVNMECEVMPNQTLELIGNWEKKTHSSCDEKYPTGVQFQKNGLYIAKNDPAGRFIVWDMGTYQIVSPREINISLANDAIASYQFSILEDVLTFKDAEGCEFNYRKVG